MPSESRANIEARVYEVQVEDHPNADCLDVVRCREYTAINSDYLARERGTEYTSTLT